MLVGVAAASGDLLNLQVGSQQQGLGSLHAAAHQNVDEGLPLRFFDTGAQMVGADVQHGGE